MEVVINANMLIVRKHFFVYMHEWCRLQLEMRYATSGWTLSYPELAWPVKQAGLYITTLYSVWALKTYFPKQTASDTADILCHNVLPGKIQQLKW